MDVQTWAPELNWSNENVAMAWWGYDRAEAYRDRHG